MNSIKTNSIVYFSLCVAIMIARELLRISQEGFSLEGLFITLLVIGSSFFVFWDAEMLEIQKDVNQSGLINFVPWQWGVFVMFLWILALPLYIAKRKKLCSNPSLLEEQSSHFKNFISSVIVAVALLFVGGIVSANAELKSQEIFAQKNQQTMETIRTLFQSIQNYRQSVGSLPKDLFAMVGSVDDFNEELAYATDPDYLFEGYYYEYKQMTADNFELFARPKDSNYKTYYINDKGQLHENDKNGSIVD